MQSTPGSSIACREFIVRVLNYQAQHIQIRPTCKVLQQPEASLKEQQDERLEESTKENNMHNK